MKSEKEDIVISKVLVAVDGSENSIKAARVAAEIAKNTASELTILHVMTIPYSAFSGDVPLPLDDMEREARKAGEEYLSKAISAIKDKKIRVNTAITESYDSPVRGITEYAKKNNFDLIVVGTRGLGGFKRLVLGSVASGVVHYAHCSVTVVR
ncbi:MAG: universal stress protein [Nitrososphaerota archaeon]|nr:universal stress protein [Nitrososphaerota archaeon]